MRSVVALIVLGGCQVVFPLEGPPVAGDGATGGDGNPPRDGVQSTTVPCEVTEGPRFDVGLTFGTHFTPDLDTDRAVKLVNGTIRTTEVSAELTTELGYTTQFESLPASFLGVTAPALAATGDRMIVRAHLDDGRIVFAESTRLGADTWSTPIEIQFRDTSDTPITVSDLQETSPITQTTPAHLLMHSAGGFTEYYEVAAGAWRAIATYDNGSLGLPELRHPTLTENGLRLVFVGQPTEGAPELLYTYKRSTIDEPFTGAPAVLYDNEAQTETYPYLSNDCKLLWYTAEIGGQIREVGFQL